MFSRRMALFGRAGPGWRDRDPSHLSPPHGGMDLTATVKEHSVRGRPSTEPPASDDLEDAVLRAQQGDEAAFRILYRDVQPRLLRYLYTLVGPDAEDVASDAWLQIARDLRSFHGDGDGFRGWAATIARNRALDHLRWSRRRPAEATPMEVLTELAGGDDPARLALDTLSTDAAVKLISSLPRDQAEAVMLRVVVGLDAEGAGRVLGKRAGAIRTAAYRGLRSLAKRLENSREIGVTPGAAAALRGTK